MHRIVAAIICLIFFLFGLIRIGVSAALMAQIVDLINVEAFAEPIADTNRFLSEKNDQALIPLTPLSYLGVIVFMGLCLAGGAVGAWRRRDWGYGLIGLYLATHAGLFVNFQTINPKIAVLGIGIFLFLLLLWANGRKTGALAR